jgi:UDP-N-acetylmuramoyl-tripeptide--D-alanyl-D-alanine ligase
MRFSASELADALDGNLHGADTALHGLTIDSRQVSPGQLFAAVRGVRDGHDFVDAAAAAGAAAALVERPAGEGVTSVVVADVGRALIDLARWARSRLPDRVVGITGSVGKTTTKDMMAAVLGRRFVTAASEKSFNNELGVPLTLANAPDDVEAVVVEMGARGVGHIALLCEMAAPTVGVVTTVQSVHTELMGSLEGIARAKGELVESLPPDGLAVLNADVALVAAMAGRTAARVVTFGDRGDVRASQITVDDGLHPGFLLESDWGRAQVRLGVRGAHNVGNALAAAATALCLGVEIQEVVHGLGASSSSPWRMDLRRAPSGALVLNDSYNAGPASVAAALQALASLEASRRIAVLGLMAELGDTAEAEHRRIVELAGSLGIEVVAVGTDLYGLPPVDGVDAAEAALGALGAGDAVLIKGSRVAGLEVLAEALLR